MVEIHRLGTGRRQREIGVDGDINVPHVPEVDKRNRLGGCLGCAMDSGSEAPFEDTALLTAPRDIQRKGMVPAAVLWRRKRR